MAEVIAVESAAPDATPRTTTEELGTIKWFDAQKGYGFILRDGRTDVFVHASVLQRCGIAGLKEGERVVVAVAEGRKGPQAVSIRPA